MSAEQIVLEQAGSDERAQLKVYTLASRAGKAAAVAEILRYALGSSRYRETREGSFLKAVVGLGADYTVAAVELAHLGGLLLRPGQARRRELIELRRALTPLARYQQLHARLLGEELQQIGRCLKSCQRRPVLLKGSALWGSEYKQPWRRRAQDLDLLLIRRDDQVRALQALGSMGYTTIQPVTRANRHSHYAYPGIWRTITKTGDKRVTETVAGMKRLSPYHLKIVTTPIHYSVRIDLELHKGLYLFQDGTLPQLRARDIIPHPTFRWYSILSREGQLPYLAAKFGMDVDELRDGNILKLKSAKLLADFISLLTAADQNTVARSVILANRWGVSDFYRRMLGQAIDLVPEVKIADLNKAPKEDIVKMLARLITKVL